MVDGFVDGLVIKFSSKPPFFIECNTSKSTFQTLSDKSKFIELKFNSWVRIII